LVVEERKKSGEHDYVRVLSEDQSRERCETAAIGD
jgi:hypothetical protein